MSACTDQTTEERSRLRGRPRFRADHVGSLLRPARLITAHASHARGELSTEELREEEDQAIKAAVQMQRDIGLDVVSDGEFRRGGWMGDLTLLADGFVPGAAPIELNWHPEADAPHARDEGEQPIVSLTIDQKLTPRADLTRLEAAFLRKTVTTPFKLTLPAPSYVVARTYRPGADAAYATRAEALEGMSRAVRAEVDRLVGEGVPYIQLDNPHYPDYLMPEIRAQWEATGIDPNTALRDDIAADNAAIAGALGSGSTVAMHLCRGNGGAAGWHATGSYEPIAEQLFSDLAVDRLLLEFDSERAGGFEPLRFVSRSKTVVLGLVTTKSSVLEASDALLGRIDEASTHLDIDNLALSPQCGFASVLLGNALDADTQRRKLELIVATARKVWG